ncbi:MAG: CDP-alcohol phosphatidyltransferase family protein [Robiginitomaculum sp.]|nr:CDP-alcohol phosphatidyltransferase family protein [Robiginitomaculum sp.]
MSQIPDPAQYGRPISIENYSNRYVVHPLSNLIVKIAIPLKLSANVVSVLGLSFGLLAGWFYFGQGNWHFALLGFACMFTWHVLDGADGRIARATNSTSALGRIIDGVCDHLVFASVYLGFTFYLLELGSSQLIWILAVGAAASHAFQAAAYEERRQHYHRRSQGLTRAPIAEGLTHIDGKRSALARGYDVVQRLSARKTSVLDEKLANLHAGNTAALYQETVNKTVPLVRAWALLNANNRTIMFAICALIGQPALYFWIELVILNLVFFGLVLVEDRTENALAQQIELPAR